MSATWTAALEPARILSNMTDQKVNMSSTVVFTCDASGTPYPSVVWTKNNHTVQEGSGKSRTTALSPVSIQASAASQSRLTHCV